MLHDTDSGRVILDMMSEAPPTKAKTDKEDSIKLCSFYPARKKSIK